MVGRCDRLMRDGVEVRYPDSYVHALFDSRFEIDDDVQRDGFMAGHDQPVETFELDIFYGEGPLLTFGDGKPLGVDGHRAGPLQSDDWDVGDGTKVEKIILSLANPADTRLVLEGMIEDGFFNKPKSLADTAKHLYIDREDRVEEKQVLATELNESVVASKLKVENGAYFLG